LPAVYQQCVIFVTMLDTIDHHISNLLFHHDIVVIPSFGAFITRRYPAEINQATHMLRPPSKRVSYNRRIKDNDGVLAQYISKVEHIPYNQALESIAISVRSWERVLRSGKKVNLHGVGKLFMDEAGKVQFSPGLEVNYEIQAYGLSIFRTQAVKRNMNLQRDLTKAYDQAEQAETAIPTAHKGKRTTVKKAPAYRWRWAAILVPIAALSLAGYLFQSEIQSQFKGVSSLNPLTVIRAWGSSDSEGSIQQGEERSATFSLMEMTTDSPASNNASPTEGENPPRQKESTEAAQPKAKEQNLKSETPASQALALKSSIVVGSFASQGNAIRHAEQLQSKGYSAQVVPYPGKSMYRVIIQTTQPASQALREIRRKVNATAWVL